MSLIEIQAMMIKVKQTKSIKGSIKYNLVTTKQIFA